MNASHSCKSFGDNLAYNSPAVICPTSCSFSLCIYSLLLSNRLKGTSVFLSEVLFLHSFLPSSALPHTFQLPLPTQTLICFSTQWVSLCSVKVLPTCTVVWKIVLLGRGSYCDCRAYFICFCSCLYHSSALPIVWCLETAASYISSWLLGLCGGRAISESVTSLQPEWNNAAKFFKLCKWKVNF